MKGHAAALCLAPGLHRRTDHASFPSFTLRSGGIIPFKGGCREVRYAHRLAARLCAGASKTDGLAAEGERRGGESAPKARGMERPAPLPGRVAAGNNTLAPAGRGKAATDPATRGAMQSGVRRWRLAPCATRPRSPR
jgi:hypothetical protein